MPVTDILSIQLYTLRSLNDLDKVLDTVAAVGFRNVEGVGSHLDDAANVKAKLDARGLRFSSSHVGLAALRERPDSVVAACKLIGFNQLFMPAVPPQQRDMDASGWRSLGRELGALATRFADAGIQLGYHNHNWELKPKDGGTTALELVFAEAEGSPLTWQADVAWLVRGGAEPDMWLWRYRDRLVSAHVKDIAPAGENSMKMAGPMWARACWTGLPCGGPAATAAHSGWWSSMTSRPTPNAAPAQASLISAGCRADRHGTDDHRYYRLRQYQRRLPCRCGALATSAREIGCRHPCRSGGGGGTEVRRGGGADRHPAG